MRDKKSDPNRWTANRADAETEALPAFGEGLAPSRTVFEELRKYPFFFADDNDDEQAAPSTTPVARADMERSAAAPRVPAPLAEIRPLLPQAALTEERAEAKSKPAASVRPAAPARPVAPQADTAAPEANAEMPAAPAVSLAERHAAALARKQAAPVVPTAAPTTDQPTDDTELEEATAPRVARAASVAQEPQTEPWYSRVPTGMSLVAVIVYFLIGGIALVGTGLVLGGIGGTLMALFGLAVTAVAAFVAWQELTNTAR